MSKIIVKDDNVNDAIKKFGRITSETRRSMKRHEYYLRPGMRAVEKSKEAKKFASKRKKFA
ncbi:MAG: 30S ribosomal protein S21 [Mycoplasmataceae bacterium]|jgi:small subunit ribosomal protein S21|nr:30S ribosomal protein S21 [Mycoplasmataceae bacterium]